MRVVHVATSLAFTYGGPARSVSALAAAQADLGCEVVLIAPRDGPDSDLCLPHARSLSVEIVEKTSLRHEMTSRSQTTDLMHTHGIWSRSNRLAASVARSLGKPLVISPRGMLYPEAMARKRWKKLIGWWSFQRRDLLGAKLIHATSQEEEQTIRRAGWTGPVVIAPNGVEIPHVGENKNPTGKRRLLFMSRLHKRKGLFDLLESWAKVRPEGWELAVAGPDEDGTLIQAKDQTRRLGIESDVLWCGSIPAAETAQMYASAEIFVLPSDFENFGSAIAESLAAGTPVICNQGAPWSGVATNKCGWWIATGTNALTATIAEATQRSSEELRAMGLRGRDWMKSEFGWRAAASRVIEAYKQMLLTTHR